MAREMAVAAARAEETGGSLTIKAMTWLEAAGCRHNLRQSWGAISCYGSGTEREESRQGSPPTLDR